MKMKKITNGLVKLILLAGLVKSATAGPVVFKTYGRMIGEVELEDGRRIEALKGIENSEIPEGAVQYEEWSPWENIEGTPNSFPIKKVIDYNNNGKFDEEDHYTLRNEGEGKNPVKGQKLLDELKRYFFIC